MNIRTIQQEASASGLVQLVWTGEHNLDVRTNLGGPEMVDFQIVDNDGFFSIMMLSRIDLQSDRERNIVNRQFWSQVPTSEMILMRKALEIGSRFYPAAIAYGSQMQTPPPNWERSLETMQQKQAFHEGWLNRFTEEQSSAPVAGRDDIVLSQAFEILTSRTLDSFVEGFMTSQYRDRSAAGAVSRLCDQSAPNALVGRIVCSALPLPAEPVPMAYYRSHPSCKKGVLFSSVPAISRVN